MNDEAVNRTLAQAFELGFQPEIDRRLAAGALKPDFVLWGAQVIMDPDRAAPVVRLNEEVRGVVTARTDLPVTAGELARPADLEHLVGMSLTDEDPNAGHFTALVHLDRWYVFFDFRYNAGRILNLLQSADQFLEAARLCIDKQLALPAVDNLYDAVQIMAKAILLTTPDRKVMEAKSHGFIETKLNLHGTLGNVARRSVQTLNRLKQLRPLVRYSTESRSVPVEELRDLLEGAESMRAEVEAHRPKRQAAQPARSNKPLQPTSGWTVGNE